MRTVCAVYIVLSVLCPFRCNISWANRVLVVEGVDKYQIGENEMPQQITSWRCEAAILHQLLEYDWPLNQSFNEASSSNQYRV